MEHEARHKERGAHSAQTQSQHFPREILRIRNLIEHFHFWSCYSLCSTLGDRKCSFETRPPTRKPENHARHEAACSNSTPLLEIDLYSVSIFYNCLIEGISLCFTLSWNQIKSERSHSLSRIGWSRPWLRL